MSSFLFFFFTLFLTLTPLFSQENNANPHAPLTKASSVILDLPEATVEELFSSVFLGQEKEFSLSSSISSSLPTRSDHQQANEWAFAGILENGSIYAWGDPSKGGASPILPKNLDGSRKRAKSIFSNVWSFVATLEDDSLWEWGCDFPWGSPINRAVPLPLGRKATCCLASTASAFAVVLDDGSLFTWGTNPSAKKTPLLPKEETGSPKKPCCLHANQETFTAVFPDKTLLAWGNLNGGGESDHKTVTLPSGKKLLSICSLAVAQSAFAAILEDHSLFVWGKLSDQFCPPKIPSGKTPLSIAAGDDNFTVLLEDKEHRQSFLSWGNNFCCEEKKLPPGRKVKADCCVAATYSAFATILDDGSLFTWGDPNSGGDFRNQPKNRAGKMIGACCLVANDQAFSASLEDGAIVSWGNYWLGGTFYYNHGTLIPAEEEGDFYAISAKACCLVANHGAFSGFLNDGVALAWGSYLYGGTLEQEDSWSFWSRHSVEVNLFARSINPQHHASITSLVSNGSAFAAITDQGSLLKWGLSNYGGGYDEELLPKDLPGKQKLKTIATPLKKETYYPEDKLAGIALIENKTTPEVGEWQYSSSCDSQWKSIPHDLTEKHAFCLAAGTKLRFVSAAHAPEEAALLQVKLLSVRAPCFQTSSMSSTMGNASMADGMSGMMEGSSMDDSLTDKMMGMGCCFVDLTEQTYLDSSSSTSVMLSSH